MIFNNDGEKKQYVDKMTGLLLAKIEIMKVVENHLYDGKESTDDLINIINFYKECDEALLKAEKKIEKEYDLSENQTLSANAAFFANKVYNINQSSVEMSTIQKNK